jgi:hypothetical protein
MPFVYMTPNWSVATPFTTHATPNTEIDSMFLKPGTRTIGLQSLGVGGKGAALTSLSGIAYRIKKWFTTGGSGGTAITPAPSDPGAQAAKATAGGATAGVTTGTGGPTFQCGCVSGGASGSGWMAQNPDSMKFLEGSANQSLNLFVSSGTASMAYEAMLEHQE